MRKVYVIGIGAGDPEHVTVQAIEALNRVDVFFAMDKGPAKADLLRLRTEICRRFIRGRQYRTVEVADPVRDKAAADYHAGVRAWHGQRAVIYEALIRDELDEDGCGAFLSWGEPSLYDSTLRILDQVAARGNVAFTYEMIPGISSLQVLVARHRIPMNRIGESIRITTGRQLAEGQVRPIDNVFVMLDGECAFKRCVGDDLLIYWGAYLGTDKELLIAGPLDAVAGRIEQVRAEARARHGWIMDAYLLRRPGKM
ncbi:precorrin-6A synthase (deacetylating) [Rhodoligotrophos defluvii]|uniref:precorrin-6A synthase (deacetylating) n=1 Tax=Rhodoligotrophos defluvii TaxID=2561934 RepID=UPI0010C97A0E|nr:precorrin-6A synthase (deacetylating) [Rhodoligotrophos defluvii]